MPTPTTPPTPAQQLAEDIQSLQSKLNNLQSQVRLSNLRDELEDLETTTNGLGQRVRDLRSQGYAFEKELEARAADLKRRWAALRLLALQQITQQSNQLDMEVRSVETLMMQLTARANNLSLARPMVSQTESAVSSLESKVSGAETSIRGMYDTYQAELRQFTTHLDEVTWMLTQLAQACFRLLPTECGILAVEAVWVKDGKEDKGDPKGVLYLTDQRILFEQKQEVATKKVLFITTEKQKVQQLLLEVPVVLMETVKGSKQGLFSHEDHLELTFASGAPFYTLHFHLDGQDSSRWQGLLGQAKSKIFDQDRAVAIDASQVEKAKSAPSQCPACGGAVNQPVLRGMDSLDCEFCGYVMRL